MKTILLSFFVIFTTCLYSQRYKSSCDTTGNYGYFKPDMDQVLLQHIKLSNPAEFDTAVEIRQDSLMFYLQRLSTLRNYKGVKAIDTIFGALRIHNDEKVYMNTLNLGVDKFASWVNNLKNNQDSSGHPVVDKYIRDYKMSNYVSSSGTWMIFTSGVNVNMQALSKKFLKINGVSSAQAGPAYYGERSYFEIMRTNDSMTKATFHFGFGDCPAGCIHWVHWKFNIYNDCSFEYLGISGDTSEFFKLPLSIGTKRLHEINVYPNPFSSSLNIKNAEPGFSYEIVDLSGRMICSGLISDGHEIDTRHISPGMYTLKVFSDNLMSSSLIAKY
jgi:hypothetical protein